MHTANWLRTIVFRVRKQWDVIKFERMPIHLSNVIAVFMVAALYSTLIHSLQSSLKDVSIVVYYCSPFVFVPYGKMQIVHFWTHFWLSLQAIKMDRKEFRRGYRLLNRYPIFENYKLKPVIFFFTIHLTLGYQRFFPRAAGIFGDGRRLTHL